MSGQCYGCGAAFGVFKKEHGCKNCGFAFCNACLHDKTVPVPKKNNAKHHVCQKCFKILTGVTKPGTDQEKYDLPEAYLKRMAALKEREAGGHSLRCSQSITAKTALPGHLHRLDKADRELVMRLEKLKQDDKPKEKITDSDIHARLAQLKDQAYVPEQKPVYKPPDRRTESEQVDDLLEQLTAEVYIDSQRPDPVQDVEQRLTKFRQGSGVKPAVDNNNLDRKDKEANFGNDLNKVDKMGQMGRGYNQDGRNIQVDVPGASASAGDQGELQEMQRLMAQAAREVERDAQRAMEDLKQDRELINRLREIQKQKPEISSDADGIDSDADNTSHSENTTEMSTAGDDDDDDDESAAKKIIQRYVEESKIDDAVGDSKLQPGRQTSLGIKDEKKKKRANTSRELKPSNLRPPSKEDLVDSDYDDADELPYCCICTEDATIRCRDCDMDLYCQKCFHGCHAEMNITDHRTSPYTAPKGYR